MTKVGEQDEDRHADDCRIINILRFLRLRRVALEKIERKNFIQFLRRFRERDEDNQRALSILQRVIRILILPTF